MFKFIIYTTMNISDYVIPLTLDENEGSFQGTAFCIENYLITAGHVVRYVRNYHVKSENKYSELYFNNWIPKQIPAKDKLGYDVAIYPIVGLESPLSLSDEDAEKDDELDVLCWQFKDGRLQQVFTPCIVRGDADEDGYFQISTAERITHGASGCPVYKDGKVYGILTMGRDYYKNHDGFTGIPPEYRHLMQKFEENTCFVFKTSHIKRFMPQNVD